MHKKINLQVTFLAVLITLFTCNLVVQASSESDKALSLQITTPSNEQQQVAPGRDFYVLGEIKGQIPDNASMQIELYRQGEAIPQQSLYADAKYKPENLNIGYSALSYYGNNRAELSNSMMPDLVYDANNPATFRDAWRKCCFSDHTFAAVFCGGNYDRDLNLTDRYGNAIPKLQAGEYLIKVSLYVDGKLLAENSKTLHVDYYANKILSRFSPAKHFAKVKEFAANNNYQVFLDLFPGYWSPKNSLSEFADFNIFAEILPRWRLADALEYDAGHTHMVLYNISPRSATYSVEIGRLTFNKNIVNPQVVTAYYYNVGEPELQNGRQQGVITQLADNDTLQFTRADINVGQIEDNLLRVEELDKVAMDLNIYDGLKVKKGEKFALNGVIRPIANAANDVLHNDDETYSVSNTISTIEYNLAVGRTVKVWKKPVTGLIRQSNNRNDLSLVEFRHVFEISPNTEGDTALLTVQAYDKYGKFVPGSLEKIQLQLN